MQQPILENRSGPARPRGFWRNERGVAAVEMAFVMPIMVLLLSGIIQFGALMFLQNHMTNVARDTARQVSVGEMTTAEATTAAQNALLDWGITYAISVTLVPDVTDPTDIDVVVNISAPMSEAAIVDVLGLFQGGNLAANVTMRQE